MPGYVGFQAALELSNILPVKEYVDAGFKRILAFASQLRRSGSDIVVEEILAELFGRATLSLKLEEEFKSIVKTQNIKPLYHGSDIELHRGPGPTVLRGLGPKDNRGYLATVVVLSMLGSFQSSDQLSSMIDWAMNKRAEARIPNSSPSPGLESISSTLPACLSQTSQFLWTPYKAIVEEKLRSFVPDFRPHPDYMRMTSTLFLGAADFLFAAQKLPDNRKVIVSNEIGCIPLIIWASVILELTVVIESAPKGRLTFGYGREAHLTIEWKAVPTSDLGDLHWPVESDTTDQVIRLQEADTTVLLSIEPDGEEVLTSIVEERHTLSGYGTTYLQRLLNATTVTSMQEQIFVEIVNVVTGIALLASQKMFRAAGPEVIPLGCNPFETAEPIKFELWRVFASAKLIFAGLSVNEAVAESYWKFYSVHSLDFETLPHTFASFLKGVKLGDSPFRPAQRLIDQITHLATIVLLFAHVVDVERCAAMPLILKRGHIEFWRFVESVAKNPHNPGLIAPSDVFYGVNTLLSSRVLDDKADQQKFSIQSSQLLFLCSDYGWSVFFNTLGDQDPAQVRPELVNVRQGVPTNRKTMERKMRVRDGRGFRALDWDAPWTNPLETGITYCPRSAAKTRSRKEFWATGLQEFELIIYVAFKMSEEWQRQTHPHALDEVMGPRNMLDCLWQVRNTPECEHERSFGEDATHRRLMPDAAALLGWTHLDETTLQRYPQRILILLTHRERHVRWAAVLSASRARCNEPDDRRTMLRTEECCETCALACITELPGRWTLIL